MGAFLAGACIGAVVGLYAERAYDLSFRLRSGWDRFNSWRKG